MPSISGVDIPTNLPQTLNGRDLKKMLKVPENRILTRLREDGTEEVIKNNDTVTAGAKDHYDSISSFARG